MPRPFPRDFREDVIRVARNREPNVRNQGHRPEREVFYGGI